jgi:hypothetical protein
MNAGSFSVCRRKEMISHNREYDEKWGDENDSDAMLYEDKKQFYERTGKDRRKKTDIER